MSKTYLALDIRDHAISAVLIKSGLKGNFIQGHVHVPVKGHENPEYQPEDAWREAIAKAVEKLEATGAACLITLPPALVSYRNLRIPFKDNRKIRQVLPYEIEPLLPFPLDDVMLDFQTVLASESSDVIAAAVEKAKLQPILNAVSPFGFIPQVIMPGGLPVALCIARQNNAENYLYIDVDESTSTIFALVSGRVYMVRSIYTGAAAPEKRIRTLKANLQRFLVTFETIYAFDFQPARAYFSGPGISDEAVLESIGEVLAVPAEPLRMGRPEDLDLLNNFNTPANELPAHANNPLCLVNIDILRIPTLNFFQDRFALYRYWEEYKSDIIRTGIIGALVLIIGMYGVIFQARHLSQQVNRIDRQIGLIFQSTFPDVSKIVDPLQQMQINVRQAKNKNIFAGSMNKGALNVDILNDLSRLIPPSVDVIITRFVRAEGSVLISGHTDTFNAVDDIKGALSTSEYFDEITISSANMDKSTNRVQFKLKLIIPEAESFAG